MSQLHVHYETTVDNKTQLNLWKKLGFEFHINAESKFKNKGYALYDDANYHVIEFLNEHMSEIKDVLKTDELLTEFVEEDHITESEILK